MGQCLITKLKGTVSNNTLLKVGELRINFSATGSSRKMQIRFTSDITLVCTGGFFTDESLSVNNGTTYTCKQDKIETIYVSNGSGYISCLNGKYKCSLINISNSCYFIDTDDLKFDSDLLFAALDSSLSTGGLSSLCLARITDLGVSTTNIYGDISAIANCKNLNTASLYNSPNIKGDIAVFKNTPKLTSLILGNAGIYGDIISFSSCLKLTTLNIPRTNLTGTVESLANALFTAGRNSGQIKLTCDNTHITFNGQPCNFKIIKFSSTGVTYADS